MKIDLIFIRTIKYGNGQSVTFIQLVIQGSWLRDKGAGFDWKFIELRIIIHTPILNFKFHRDVSVAQKASPRLLLQQGLSVHIILLVHR